MDRAAALGRFRVGSPLSFEQLRFTRSDSEVALAGTIAQKVPTPVQDHAPVPVRCVHRDRRSGITYE